MDVDGIFSRVKGTFGDESGVQINDAEIIRWINDAQREIIMHNETVLQETTTINLVADQNTYAFPSDLFVLRSVRVKTADAQSYTRLESYSLHEFDRHIDGWDGTLRHSGRPRIYTTYERELFIFPTPNQAATDGLKLLYSKNPTEITSSVDPLSLPEIYHNAIVNYCLSQANIKDNDYEASSLLSASFATSIQFLSERENTVAKERYPTITVLPEDM